ncbi:putative membrane protein [Sphingomonas zeicaulis]|uniref:cytochrome c oxidase assembly protein n=1 Tax=Sphingomonas zeicaulis TaxID=1632740 RepID=UPI003D1C712D
MAMKSDPTPYCGSAPLPAELITRWNLDPVLLIGLVAAAILIRRLPGKTERAAAMIALALCALSFVSPLCAMTSALFSARVAHHLILITVVAPMLAGAVRPAGSLAGWTFAHALILWGWHAPAFYGAALSNDILFWLMQASLLGSAIGFWAGLRRATPPAAIIALAATMAQMGLLGALITFAAAPLYAPHWLTTAAWGLSPLDDQRLAGLLMWIPGSLAYLGALLTVAWRLLGRLPDHQTTPSARGIALAAGEHRH